MTTVQSLWTDAARTFERNGMAQGKLDAQLLMAHVLGISREEILFSSEKKLNNNEISVFNTLVARRAQHEPIAYITGKKEFWSLDFCVTRDTLIPRPDSETLIEAALKRVRNIRQKEDAHEQARTLTLLDIGTGTGCLLITMLKQLPEARGVGIDNNKRALLVAEDNAKRHGVADRARFFESNWCDATDGTFDLILSNPPYIAVNSSHALMPDVVRFEPHGALFAGADGLDAYRALAPQIALRLNAGGYALLEVGQGQAEEVTAMLVAQGLEAEESEKDLGGIARCVVARNKQ